MEQPLTFKDGVKKENKRADKPLNHNQALTRAIETKQMYHWFLHELSDKERSII